MQNRKLIKLNTGFIFDYTSMIGDNRITENDLLKNKYYSCIAGIDINKMRKTGKIKGHSEPVYFTKLPYIKKGNPNTPDSIKRLNDFSSYVEKEIDIVIIFGIGGSYLGGKTLFDIFCGEGWNILSNNSRKNRPYIFFTGNNIDPFQDINILKQVEDIISNTKPKNKKFKIALIPISKSGNTIETLASFSYHYEQLITKSVDLEVYVVTDKSNTDSRLYGMAIRRYNWEIFDIPKGIGGRFSIFSNVGLIVASIIGINIEKFLDGAKEMDIICKDISFNNPALLNATLKYLSYKKYNYIYDIEVFMCYGSRLKSLGEWYVQLLSESLGKRFDRNNKYIYYGRTPMVSIGSTDTHSQLQQHQDGRNNKIVQFLQIDEVDEDINLINPIIGTEYCGISFNRTLNHMLLSNNKALDIDNRFSAIYKLPKLNEFYIGQLLYFLMLSIAYEAELANINAYDQPGVDTYKHYLYENF